MFQTAFCLRALCAAVCFLLVACSTQPPVAVSKGFEPAALLDGEVFDVGFQDHPAPVELTHVNTEMREFLRERVPSHLGKEQKVELILRAILDDGLSLDYDNFKTYTAEEAFYLREGNCLSFTNLFVALAREAGLKVTYQEVEVPPNWERRNDTYFYNRHINALVHLPYSGKKAVDFNIDEFDSSYPRRSISDNYAKAQYFNNMGVHWLEEERYDRAFIYIREAIRLQPYAAYFWTNMGSLYSRAGYGSRAEAAWLTGLDIDDDPSAMSNLARYYEASGQAELALWYADRVEHYRRQNPYYLYELARAAYQRNDYEQSLQWLQQSLKLREGEHQFYRLQGLVYLKAGAVDEARHSFELAERYASSEHERRVYSKKQRLLVQVGQ
ncbi:MAG: transglutaminase domain-containing protein [Halioglobus sp.]